MGSQQNESVTQYYHIVPNSCLSVWQIQSNISIILGYTVFNSPEFLLDSRWLTLSAVWYQKLKNKWIEISRLVCYKKKNYEPGAEIRGRTGFSTGFYWTKDLFQVWGRWGLKSGKRTKKANGSKTLGALQDGWKKETQGACTPECAMLHKHDEQTRTRGKTQT